MKIYRIDANSQSGVVMVDVADEYELQANEFKELPATGYTPYKVVNGKLVASTESEHIAFNQQWQKDHGVIGAGQSMAPSAQQQANAQIMMSLAQIQANQDQAQQQAASQAALNQQQSQINAMLLMQLAQMNNGGKN